MINSTDTSEARHDELIEKIQAQLAKELPTLLNRINGGFCVEIQILPGHVAAEIVSPPILVKIK